MTTYSTYRFEGQISGFMHMPHAFELRIHPDNTLCGTITRLQTQHTETNEQEEEVEHDDEDDESLATYVIVHGKASIDLFETDAWKGVMAHSSVFGITRRQHGLFHTIWCKARLSSINGVFGQYGLQEPTAETPASQVRPFTLAIPNVRQHPIDSTKQSLLPLQAGSYTFHGTATCEGGMEYHTNLQLTLRSDGHLHGESIENNHPDGEQPCALVGKWTADGAIEYTLSYEVGNQVSYYGYHGYVVATSFNGTWANKNEHSARMAHEHGRFVFGCRSASTYELTTEPQTVSKKTMNSKAETLPSPTAQLAPLSSGTYELVGVATSAVGYLYQSRVTLTLAADGKLRGTSREDSDDGVYECTLEGTWNKADQTMRYTMHYGNPEDPILYIYEMNANASILSGMWRDQSLDVDRQHESPSQHGTCQYEVQSMHRTWSLEENAAFPSVFQDVVSCCLRSEASDAQRNPLPEPLRHEILSYCGYFWFGFDVICNN